MVILEALTQMAFSPAKASDTTALGFSSFFLYEKVNTHDYEIRSIHTSFRDRDGGACRDTGC